MSAAPPPDLSTVIEQAFDYRGDVTVTTRDGRAIEGYVFDRSAGELRMLPKDGGGAKLKIAISEIAGIAITGRDTAAGKSWEAWVKKYHERKAAGETGIALEPEPLD